MDNRQTNNDRSRPKKKAKPAGKASVSKTGSDAKRAPAARSRKRPKPAQGTPLRAIRISDAAFARKLAGKYGWSTGAGGRRAAIVHRDAITGIRRSAPPGMHVDMHIRHINPVLHLYTRLFAQVRPSSRTADQPRGAAAQPASLPAVRPPAPPSAAPTKRTADRPQAAREQAAAGRSERPAAAAGRQGGAAGREREPDASRPARSSEPERAPSAVTGAHAGAFRVMQTYRDLWQALRRIDLFAGRGDTDARPGPRLAPDESSAGAADAAGAAAGIRRSADRRPARVHAAGAGSGRQRFARAAAQPFAADAGAAGRRSAAQAPLRAIAQAVRSGGAGAVGAHSSAPGLAATHGAPGRAARPLPLAAERARLTARSPVRPGGGAAAAAPAAGSAPLRASAVPAAGRRRVGTAAQTLPARFARLPLQPPAAAARGRRAIAAYAADGAASGQRAHALAVLAANAARAGARTGGRQGSAAPRLPHRLAADAVAQRLVGRVPAASGQLRSAPGSPGRLPAQAVPRRADGHSPAGGGRQGVGGATHAVARTVRRASGSGSRVAYGAAGAVPADSAAAPLWPMRPAPGTTGGGTIRPVQRPAAGALNRRLPGAAAVPPSSMGRRWKTPASVVLVRAAMPAFAGGAAASARRSSVMPSAGGGQARRSVSMAEAHERKDDAAQRRWRFIVGPGIPAQRRAQPEAGPAARRETRIAGRAMPLANARAAWPAQRGRDFLRRPAASAVRLQAATLQRRALRPLLLRVTAPAFSAVPDGAAAPSANRPRPRPIAAVVGAVRAQAAWGRRHEDAPAVPRQAAAQHPAQQARTAPPAVPRQAAAQHPAQQARTAPPAVPRQAAAQRPAQQARLAPLAMPRQAAAQRPAQQARLAPPTVLRQAAAPLQPRLGGPSGSPLAGNAAARQAPQQSAAVPLVMRTASATNAPAAASRPALSGAAQMTGQAPVQRQLRDLQLEVAARSRDRGRTDDDSAVASLQSAVKTVEKELQQAKELWAGPKLDLNRLSDQLYRELSKRIRFEQQRRGL